MHCINRAVKNIFFTHLLCLCDKSAHYQLTLDLKSDFCNSFYWKWKHKHSFLFRFDECIYLRLLCWLFIYSFDDFVAFKWFYKNPHSIPHLQLFFIQTFNHVDYIIHYSFAFCLSSFFCFDGGIPIFPNWLLKCIKCYINLK